MAIVSQMRSNYCGLVTESLMGQTVSLCGWVNRRRDHGGVIFIDLRDREGYVQVVCDPDRADMFKTAEGVRNEFCIKVVGLVRMRPDDKFNANLAPGKQVIVEYGNELWNGGFAHSGWVLDQAKADVAGMFGLKWLVDHGALPKERLEEYYASYVAGIFRTLRFGTGEAHVFAVERP